MIRRRWSSLAVSAAALGLLMAAGPSVSASTAPGGNSCLATSPAGCYAPPQFRNAYDIQPLLDHGTDGHGETVSMIELATPPTLRPPGASDIRQDLATFDRLFNLPPAQINVVTTLAGAGSPWEANLEEVTDTEIVHAIAPGAALRLVLMPASAIDSAANATADMLAALPLLVRDTDVVSFSWSLGEHFFSATQLAELRGILSEAAARHVTVVASSGDQGVLSDLYPWSTPVREVSLPASDPYVLGVGGTTLTADQKTGSYLRETAWDTARQAASAGGFSGIFARPAYQDGIPDAGVTRGVPDVAGDADPQLGMALAIAVPGTYLLLSAGGTSAAAPLWGGLAADADQLAHRDLGFINPSLYRIARGPLYGQAFHDVTTGNDTVAVKGVMYTGYQAAPGWDPVTGLGSPNAAVLVPLLGRQ